MKKIIKNLAGAITVAGAAMVSQSAHAQLSFVKNDLYMGFQNSLGSGTADYIVNMGPASSIVGGSSVVNLSSYFSASDFNSAALQGTSGLAIQGGVVGASNNNSPSDVYVTALRTSGPGNPSAAGSTAPASLTRSQDNQTYADLTQLASPGAGTGILDTSRSWETYVEPNFLAGSVYGDININPDSTVNTSAVVYEDLWFTSSSTATGAKAFVYQGYFTINFTGATPSVTFTPQAASAPFTGPNITSITVSGNTATLVWTAVATHTYQLQYTASLSSPTWINVGSGTVANSAFMTNSDTTATPAMRFYRVTAQ